MRGSCPHKGASGPCMPRTRDGRCVWCERELPTATSLVGGAEARARRRCRELKWMRRVQVSLGRGPSRQVWELLDAAATLLWPRLGKQTVDSVDRANRLLDRAEGMLRGLR